MKSNDKIILAFPEIAEILNNNSQHLGFIHGNSGFGFAVIGTFDNLILSTYCHKTRSFL